MILSTLEKKVHASSFSFLLFWTIVNFMGYIASHNQNDEPSNNTNSRSITTTNTRSFCCLVHFEVFELYESVCFSFSSVNKDMDRHCQKAVVINCRWMATKKGCSSSVKTIFLIGQTTIECSYN